jgi:hypothetical protein
VWQNAEGRDDGAGRRIDTCEVTPVIFTEEPEF